MDINDCWAVYGGVSQAFRAPNLNDLTGSTRVPRRPRIPTAHRTLIRKNTSPPNSEPAMAPRPLSALACRILHLEPRRDHQRAWSAPTPSPRTAAEDTSMASRPKARGCSTRAGLSAAWRAWNEGKTDSPVTTASDGSPASSRSPARWPFAGPILTRSLWVEGRVLGAVTEDRVHPADQAADASRIPTNGTPGYIVAMRYAGLAGQRSPRAHLRHRESNRRGLPQPRLRPERTRHRRNPRSQSHLVSKKPTRHNK